MQVVSILDVFYKDLRDVKVSPSRHKGYQVLKLLAAETKENAYNLPGSKDSM